ncbi:hypothetical protein ACX80S_02075 [Arthrobacter sp. RHLT1-20]
MQQQDAAAQQQAIVDQAAAQASAQIQAPQGAPPAALSMDEKIAKIRELGQLKEARLLKDEEFAAEKSKVLAG